MACRRHAEPPRRRARRAGARQRQRTRHPLRAGARRAGRGHPPQRDRSVRRRRARWRALFAKIDAEPVRTPRMSFNLTAWLTSFVAGFSPRTLAYGGRRRDAGDPAAGRPARRRVRARSAGRAAAGLPRHGRRSGRGRLRPDPLQPAGQCHRHQQVPGRSTRPRSPAVRRPAAACSASRSRRSRSARPSSARSSSDGEQSGGRLHGAGGPAKPRAGKTGALSTET